MYVEKKEKKGGGFTRCVGEDVPALIREKGRYHFLAYILRKKKGGARQKKAGKKRKEGEEGKIRTKAGRIGD